MVPEWQRGAGEQMFPRAARPRARHSAQPFGPLLCFTVILLGAAWPHHVAVVTYHNDIERTGQNISETKLTPDEVRSGRFRKLFTDPVDGAIYTQPLYVPALRVGKARHNVVLVATEHDSVYAFDADKAGPPLWRRTLAGGSLATPVAPFVGCDDIPDENGITGTPVIDYRSKTLYVVSASEEGGRVVQRLHALDLASGRERLRPELIAAAVHGRGLGSAGGVIDFDPAMQNQRAALLLWRGKVVVAWGSHCDIMPYHGWLMAFDAKTLHLVSALVTTPNGWGGGIWMSGSGVAAGSHGHLFFSTGNGTAGGDLGGGGDFGDSVVRARLTPAGFVVDGYFASHSGAPQAGSDLDLGSGGILLVPSSTPKRRPRGLLAGGKDAIFYFLDPNRLKSAEAHGSPLQTWSVPSSILGAPVYWNKMVYTWTAYDVIRAYSVSQNGLLSRMGGRIRTGYPGAGLSLSSNGNQGGIVWALRADEFASKGPAVLYGFDARDLSLLYHSDADALRDEPGPAVKFAIPTIAEGKVYVGTRDRLSVYGLCAESLASGAPR